VNGPTTVYEAAGGEETFTRLIERFYAAVAEDPVLRPLYPAEPESFAAAGEHLRLFLIQYWGGPATYSERRGHPRLRMRHAPFSIGRAERDAWMGHMRRAVDSLDLPPAVRDAFLDYFENAATAMMNRGGPPF
jgi:hemoglobin